ncbi:MAG: hypothetical protein AAB819_02970 [Patescibacteria group bacterium]
MRDSIFSVLAIFAIFVFAPLAANAAITLSPVNEKGAEIAGDTIVVLSPIDVATTSFSARRDGSLSISFELGNKTEFVQPGIVWSVALVKKDSALSATLSEDEYRALSAALFAPADSQVFKDAPMTLAAASSEKMTFRYEPPANLSGEYELYITFANSLSLILDRTLVGTIPLTGSGERITISGCYLTVGGETAQYTNLGGVSLADGETLVAHCGIESGMLSETSATRMLRTYEGNIYGAEVSRKKGSEMIIPQNISQMEVPIPVEKKKGAYSALLFLEKDGVPVSNKIELQYGQYGAEQNIVAIRNILFDRMSYTVGDTARVTVFWSQFESGFAAPSDGGTPFPALMISGELQNEEGETCTEKVSSPLPESVSDVPFMYIRDEVPITRDCAYPTAIVRITKAGPSGGEGETLSEIRVPLREGNWMRTAEGAWTFGARVIGVAILVLFAIGLLAFAVRMMRRKKNGGIPPLAGIAAILLLITATAFMLLPDNRAFASFGGGGGGGGGGGITFGGFAPGGGIPNTGSGFTIVGLTSSGSFIYGGITAGHGSGASSASRRTDAGGGGQSGGSQCVWVLGQCTSGNNNAGGSSGGSGGGGSQSQSPDFFLSRSNDISISLVGGNERTSNSATVTVTPQNSFSATVDLSATTITPNLPGIVYTLGDNSLVSSEYDRGSSFSVTVPGDTASGTYAITIEGRSGGLTRTIAIDLGINTLNVRYEEF